MKIKNKAYYLSTCDTCKRILKELNISKKFDLQDIKFDKITLSQLEEMRDLTDSYESLLNKRARKYTEYKSKNLSENDIKDLILEEYTFLKRPVFIYENEIFIGNSKKVVTELKTKLKA